MTSSIGPARAQLDEDGHLPVGGLAQFFDFDHHVVGTEHVRVPGWAALVDAYRQVALVGDGFGNFGAQQQAAGAGFRSLPDGQFDGAGPAQIMHVDAVAGGQHFVHIVLGKFALGWGEAAVAGRIRRA